MFDSRGSAVAERWPPEGVCQISIRRLSGSPKRSGSKRPTKQQPEKHIFTMAAAMHPFCCQETALLLVPDHSIYNTTPPPGPGDRSLKSTLLLLPAGSTCFEPAIKPLPLYSFLLLSLFRCFKGLTTVQPTFHTPIL